MPFHVPRASSVLIILLLLLNLVIISWLGVNWYDRYQDRYLNRAEQALIEDDKAKAIRAYSVHLRHHPDDVDTKERLEELKEQYRNRYLAGAESRLKVGDEVAAIEAYRKHIEHYPEDYDIQLKLASLYRRLNVNDAAESLYRGMINDLEDTDRRKAVALERLLKHINEWANEITRQANEHFDRGDYEAAAEEYARVISLHSRNPALSFDGIGHRRAVSVLNNVIAKRAFSLWRAGREEAVVSGLRSPHDADVFPGETRDGRPPTEVMRQRKTMLANFIWDYADRQFQAENWQDAAELYDRTLKMRAVAQDGDDPNTPVLLFNYALSEYRAGNPNKALQSVKRIQREYAYHEKVAVRRLRQEVEKALTKEGED